MTELYLMKEKISCGKKKVKKNNTLEFLEVQRILEKT